MSRFGFDGVETEGEEDGSGGGVGGGIGDHEI